MNCRMFFLIVFISLLNIFLVNSTDNLCPYTKSLTWTRAVYIRKTEWHTITIRCYFVWRCTERQIIYKDIPSIEKSIVTQRIQGCCSGYEWQDYRKTTCKPICTNPCDGHSHCSAPETCACDVGYVRSSNDPSVCIPDCNPRCIGGICVGPNMCQCPSHFTQISNTSNNTCVCNMGFKMNVSGMCLPVCTPSCVNGHCAAPDNCTCLPGYKTSDVQNVCSEDCASANSTDGICMEQYGSYTNSTTMENLNNNTYYWTSIGIGLSLSIIAVIGGMYLLYKRKIWNCKRTANEVKNTDEYIVTNSIYGWTT